MSRHVNAPDGPADNRPVLPCPTPQPMRSPWSTVGSSESSLFGGILRPAPIKRGGQSKSPVAGRTCGQLATRSSMYAAENRGQSAARSPG